MSTKIYAINVTSEYTQLTPKLDYLRELSGGDNNFIKEILQMFIADAPRAVEQAFQHLHEKDYQMLRITVHKLKSSVQVVGGYYLAHLINEIETASKENTAQDILQQMLSKLSAGIQHIVNHLGKEMQSLSLPRKAA